MVKNQLIMEQLKKWCDNESSTFVRFWVAEENGKTLIKGYKGHGFPWIARKFKNDAEAEKFLEESRNNEEELRKFDEEIYKEMMN